MTMQGARTMIFVTKRCNVTAQFPFILLLLMGNFKLLSESKIHTGIFLSHSGEISFPQEVGQKLTKPVMSLII